MTNIIETILKFMQPLACIVFIVAGVLSLCIEKYHQGAVNLCIALANWMIFYGGKYLK